MHFSFFRAFSALFSWLSNGWLEKGASYVRGMRAPRHEKPPIKIFHSTRTDVLFPVACEIESRSTGFFAIVISSEFSPSFAIQRVGCTLDRFPCQCRCWFAFLQRSNILENTRSMKVFNEASYRNEWKIKRFTGFQRL